MHRRPRAVVLLAVLALVVAAGVVGPRLWSAARARFGPKDCTVGSYSLSTDQASVAATMVGEVGKFRVRLPDRAALLVLMAGLQESKLTNLAAGDGDRDSVGVLQQRPSQGWGGGKASVLTDVGEATREFLAALVEVPHWRTLTPSTAIQKVQVSADGTAYAKHEPEAKALSAAFLGREPAGLDCRFDAPTVAATPQKVAQLAASDLGIDTPRAGGDGVRVAGAHWQTATWFVAWADRLGIATVAYDGRRWTRTDGWKRAPTVSDGAVVATMARTS